MHLRSLLPAFIALLLPSMLWAESVSVGRALETAQAFLSKGSIAPSSVPASDLTLVWTGGTGTVRTSSATQPSFYIFNNSNGGFVIVAGDDSVTPILGYSSKGEFKTEDMPENVAFWFSQLRDYISTGVARGYAPTAATVEAWNDIRNASATPVKYIETPEWDQGYPFNMYCPQDGEGTSYSGCVATAMAEILRTIQWPDKGTGIIPGYTTGSKSIKVASHSLGHSYDYSKMPMTAYDPTDKALWSTDACQQVGRLMYDCGTMVEMDYTKEGSGASSGSVAPALIKYMKIDGSAYLKRAYMMSENEWKAQLKKQLNSGFPLYYSARDADKQAGHAFVLDGYDSNGRFHINFGWGGYGNAYYEFPSFNGGGYKFTEDHDAVFNIKKDEGGSCFSEMAFVRYNSTDKGLSSELSSFKVGERFTVTLNGFLYNSGTTEFTGQVAMARVDLNRNLKELISRKFSFEKLKAGYGYTKWTFSCNLTGLNDGDVAMLFYKGEGQTDWTQCPYERSSGFTGALQLTSYAPSLEEETDIKFDRNTRIFHISTLKDATLSVRNSSGESIEYAGNDGDFSIQTVSLPSGIYNITLEYNDQKSTFEVVL